MLKSGRHMWVLDLVVVLRSKCLLVVHLKGIHALLELLRMHLLMLHLGHLRHLLVSMKLLHGDCGLCVHLHGMFRVGHGQGRAKAHAETRCVQVSSMMTVVEGVCAAWCGSVVAGHLSRKRVESMAIDIENRRGQAGGWVLPWLVRTSWSRVCVYFEFLVLKSIVIE